MRTSFSSTIISVAPFLGLAALVATSETAHGFALTASSLTRQKILVATALQSSIQTPKTEQITSDDEDELASDPQEQRQAVRVPLKFVGPYACLGLRFPDLATNSQRERNVTGISLDFVLDTAANTNTLNGQVAQELGLEVVGEALPGVGAGGAIQGGETYLLGNAELEGLPQKEEQFTFMEGLTASALPVASPASAGLLSLAFFHCFEGGVEFDWGGRKNEEDILVPPSLTFYGEGESDTVLEKMIKVPVTEQPITRLPSVEVTINGATFPALLDTGSPITVLNAQAAAEAGIKTVDIPGAAGNDAKKKGGNPFAKFANQFKEAQAIAQAASRGDIVAIAGANGQPVNLLKSDSKVEIGLVADTDDDDNRKSVVEFGDSNIYVGNLPGLAALNALGDDSPPAAVLGMDVLRLKPKMLFKARDQEVYF